MRTWPSHDIPFEVRTGSDAICAIAASGSTPFRGRFYNTWTRLDPKVKASIVEGASSCSCRCSTKTPCRPPGVLSVAPGPHHATETGEPRPLPPLEDLLETGHVLGLNFPVAMNRDSG